VQLTPLAVLSLCKLSADSDANVQSVAHLLDRLVKVYSPGLYSYVYNLSLFLFLIIPDNITISTRIS
jgi:hypothetical protein